MLAETFARLGDHLIIEWVPKSDPMVQKLLASREDVFPAYDEAGFEAALATRWEVIERRRRRRHRPGPVSRPTAMTASSAADLGVGVATYRPGGLARLTTAMNGFGWYPLMLALASYLQLYAVGRAEPAPAIRSFLIVCAIAIGLTAIAIRLFGRERGSAVAAIAVAALMTANGGVRVVPFVLADRAADHRGRVGTPGPGPPPVGTDPRGPDRDRGGPARHPDLAGRDDQAAGPDGRARRVGG